MNITSKLRVDMHVLKIIKYILKICKDIILEYLHRQSVIWDIKRWWFFMYKKVMSMGNKNLIENIWSFLNGLKHQRK
jgi:hypothetical protein